MFERIRRAGLLVAYQLTLLVGIVLMPVALVLHHVGGRPPVWIGRAVESLGCAYDRARGRA